MFYCVFGSLPFRGPVSVSTFTSLLLIKSLSWTSLTLFSLFCLASLATGYNIFLFCSTTLGNCSLIPYSLPLKVSLARDLIYSLSLNFSKLAINHTPIPQSQYNVCFFEPIRIMSSNQVISTLHHTFCGLLIVFL